MSGLARTRCSRGESAQHAQTRRRREMNRRPPRERRDRVNRADGARSQSFRSAAISGSPRSLLVTLCVFAAGCSDAATAQQDRALAYHKSGGEWYVQGDVDKAIVAYSKAIELDPTQADFWFDRGVAWDDQGKLAKAVADYSEAIRLAPHQTDAWYNRAYARQELGEHEAAIADFDECLRLDPQDVDSLIGRGDSRDELGAFDRAIADYNAALALDPGNSGAYNNRGYARESLGQYALALDDYARAIELDSEDPLPILNRAWLLAGCPDEAIRNAPEALRAAEQARELLGDKDPDALEALAAAHAEAGDFEAALARQSEALRWAPSDQRPEIADRLKLYQARKPFRTDPLTLRHP
jgi:tetratricopeptide (TPR) repeat protein